jgi:hypothetical protein
MRVVRTLGVVTFLVALGACSAPPSAQEQAANAEIAALAPLKAKYPGVVMGFDIPNDTTLAVSVDIQALVNAQDDNGKAMNADALARWRAAWQAQHPHQHAPLHVRIVDFRGNVILQGTARG